MEKKIEERKILANQIEIKIMKILRKGSEPNFFISF